MTANTGLVPSLQLSRLQALRRPVSNRPNGLAPVAGIVPLPVPSSSSWRHEVGAVDASGRVRLGRLLPVLGWDLGQTVVFELANGRGVVVAVDGGPLAVDELGRLRLPLALRRLCGPAALLSADEVTASLVVTPSAVLDALVEVS